MSPTEVDNTQKLPKKPAEELTPVNEDRIIEKDGEVMVRIDDVPEAPEAESSDLSEEPPAEESPPAAEADPPKPAQSGKETERYEGKSVAELHDMLDSRNATISRQGTELGDHRKAEKSREENLSDEEKLDRMSAKSYAQVVNREKDNLRSIDPEEDSDDYRKQAQLIDDMQTKLNTKTNTELVRKEVNENENNRMINEQKLIYISNGIELSDVEYDELSNVAVERYSIDGKLTTASFDHALLDIVGHDKYRTFLQVSGGLKARRAMVNAENKLSPSVNVESAGAGAKYVPLTSLTGKRLEEVIKTLPNDQIDALLERAGLKQTKSNVR